MGLYWNRKPGWELGARSCREAADVSIPGTEAHFYNARRPIPEDVVADIRARCDVVVGATAD